MRRHVHLRAHTSNWATNVNLFRLAWVGQGWSDEFFQGEAYQRRGHWPLGGALSWSSTLDLSEAGRPQTIFWQSCGPNWSSYLSHLGERYENGPPWEWPTELGSDYVYTNLACLMPAPGGLTQAVPCRHLVVGMVGMVLANGRMGTAIDTADLGTVIRVGANEATVETEDKKLVTIRWSGKLESYWESGLVLDASKDRITFSSPDLRIVIEDDGVMR